MSRILVTGGYGYLGGRIVSHLRSIGDEVSIGTRDPVRAKEHGAMLTDFEDEASLEAAFKGFDVIVHLAGMNEVEAGKNPELALHTTAVYAMRAVQAAKSAKVGKFIYFSTMHVYGTDLSGSITENSPTRPVHPYSITHRAAEDFVNQFHKDGSLDAVIVRLSNGYGYPERPGVDRWTLLANDLCREVAIKGTLTLKSSGMQYRDFIPLCDVSSAVSHFIALPRQEDPFFNVGSGQSCTVLEMARFIAARYESVTGKVAIMNVPPAKPGEKSPSFGISVVKLAATGFSARSLVPDEIDGCIKRCISWNEQGLL